MSTRYDKTLADYLVIAVSPALIMALIGSLVFFLLEVFYQGNFDGRLHYILSLFIFAAVLIGRISIEEGTERAALFALPLAVLTLLAINRFVAFHGALLESFSFVINCGLIALIWWCAHKLTWDCTMIDETESGSGEGLLDAAVLGKSQESNADQPDPEPPGRWNNWRERRKKPHAPGVWIVYFSLAALPLFGLGQLAIPAAQAGRRRYAFCLMAIYVASGLGLLLTTSFLGLRRYLRQRRMPMPLLMANIWIMVGCLLIFAVMGLALFMPRPSAEFAISQIPAVMGSPDQKPSKHGVGRDGVKSDEAGRPSSAEEKGKAAAGRGDATNPDGPSSDKQGSGPKGKTNADGKTQPQPGSDSKQETAARHSPPAGNQNNPSHDAKNGGEKSGSNRSSEGPGQAESHPGNDGETESPPPDMTPPELPEVSTLLTSVLPFLQVLFYLLVVGLGIYWAWRHRAGIAAALRDLLSGFRSLWERLWHRSSKTIETVEEGGPPQRRSFADFADPFANGMAERLSADQLVQYTFEALEAWAREHGCPRDPQQTPHEFARSAGRCEESLGRWALRLADLYCEAAYAPGRLRLASTQPLKELWLVMDLQPSPPANII